MENHIENQNPQQKEHEALKNNKKKEYPYFLLVFVLIIVGVFVYFVFIKINVSKNNEPSSINNQIKNSALIEEQTPKITGEERDVKIEAFFNN